jgi:hypothetical protein
VRLVYVVNVKYSLPKSIIKKLSGKNEKSDTWQYEMAGSTSRQLGWLEVSIRHPLQREMTGCMLYIPTSCSCTTPLHSAISVGAKYFPPSSMHGGMTHVTFSHFPLGYF